MREQARSPKKSICLTGLYKCPKCGDKHFIKIRPDTVITRYSAYCKRCKNEILVNIELRAKTVNP